MKKLESEKTQSISKFFVSEQDAIEKLHPLLLQFSIALCLEFRVKVVLESKTYMPTLMGLALGYFIKFWVSSESTVPMKLLKAC